METLKKYCKRYFIDAMGAMALGLFASLLIGTILKTLGQYTGLDFLVEINTYAAGASGMAIGVAVAYALKADPLVIYSCAAVGAIGYSLPTFFESIGKDLTAGPAGTFVAVIVACEVAKFVSKKTKVDILVTPTVTILIGYTVSRLVCPAVSFIMYWLGKFINEATMMHPLVMGIIVSVVVGMILTLPISSAAICAMIGISGLAGHRRLLRADGRLCRHQLPRKPLGRACLPRTWHLHASDGQHLPQAADLATAHLGRRRLRSDLHAGIPS